MIRYLQRLRAKKGFTIIELIVVIAIIAVLTAVILSNVGTENERKQSANAAASDFYSTVQYTFTKYMKYESDLSIAIANENKTLANDAEKMVLYYKSLNGNYPTNKTTFVKMFVDKSQIIYVQTFNSLKSMLSETSTDCKLEFDKMLKDDFDIMMESNVDGYYYALVSFDGAAAAPTQAPVKVHSAYYSAKPFTQVNAATDGADYRINNLRFEDYCLLSNGNICGVCSSVKYAAVDKDGNAVKDKDGNSINDYLGGAGTFFMGADNNALNATLGIW